MTEQGQLIVLSGPSGVGKDTVLRRFLKQSPDCALSISATTRPPREGEVDGRDYFFLTREKFLELVEKGDMLEYAEYGGNFYGTPKAKVEEQLAGGKNVILEIEVQGALKIKEMRLNVVLTFIMPPSWDVLRERLELRGTDSPEKVAERLSIAKKEIKKACLYDFIIVNDDIDICISELKTVVSAARLRTEYRQNLIKEVLYND